MEPIDISKLASQQQKRYESDFKELSKIGKGGFSKVYKVQNQVDKQQYAIKKVELKVKDIKDNIELKLERVLREARYLAKLSHPKIIRYYNSWVEVTSVLKPVDNNIVSYDQKPFKKKKLDNMQSLKNNSRDEELVFYFNSKNSNEDFSIGQGSMDNLIEFQQPIVETYQQQNQKQVLSIQKLQNQKKVKNIFQYLDNKNIASSNLGDIQQIQQFTIQTQLNTAQNINNNNEHISYSEFELSSMEDSVNQNGDKRSKKNRRMKHYKDLRLNTKKSISQECKNNIDNQKNDQLLDQFEKITIYIQTEICDQTLDDYINDRNQKLGHVKRNTQFIQTFESYAREAKTILVQIIDGLEYIHKNRLIHRDLKPSNIFMNSPEDVKIGDFGLVKKLEKLQINKTDEDDETPNVEQSAFDSSNCCTKMYASPEQIDMNFDRVKIYDHRMDIHALGMIILQLFHPMNTQMEVIKTMQDARKGQLPKFLEENYSLIAQTIGRCLSKDPKHRPSLEDISLDIISQCPFQNGCTLSGISTTLSQASVFDFSPEKIQIEAMGQFKIQMEGSPKSKLRYNSYVMDRHCVMVNRSFLIYKNEVKDSKAQYNYNLDECTLTIQKALSFAEVHIVHPLQIGCVLFLQEEHLAGAIFEKLQFTISSELWKNQFEND